MSKVSWQGGKGVEAIAEKLRVRAQFVQSEAERALALSVEDGGREVQDILEAAETRTGTRRAEKGGYPGRHDSGNMVASVGNNGDSPYRAGPVVLASFGWFASEYEAYFRDQDLGEGRIPPAYAMLGGFTLAREQFRRRMRDVVRGRSVN